MFTGRVVEPGEPEFLPADTDGAIALAEEEAATCPSCGLLKAWCRDRANQFSFVPYEEQCHASYTLAAHRSAIAETRDDAQKASMQMAARFRAGLEPDLMAGLDLPGDAHEPEDQADPEQRH